MDKLNSFVSVISLIEDNEDTIESYLQSLHTHLDENFEDYEIVLIDQNSSQTLTNKLEKLLTQIPSVRYLKLAFRVHDDVALAAGLENAIGDFVVLHSESEDPVDCISHIVKQSLDGFDIVIGASTQNQTIGYKLIRPLIQRILKQIGYNVPRNATGLRCLSRRAVNAVTQSGKFHHKLYVRINNTGYPYTVFHYAQKNYNDKKRTLRNGILQGLYLLIFNSTRPLRWMSGLGVFGSLMAFSFSLYSIVIHYFKETVIEGWTTMVLFTSMLFMIMFMILAFFGEYLGRLLNERNDQNDYTVSFEKTSSVMLNEKRKNVINN
ncbi:MAG: glycosyltransferase [Gammaproteobacteria bacterium]|nr:glycosyltransferase [Gammaproteobacteria bacterium]